MKTIKLAMTILAVAIAAMTTAVEKPKVNVIPLNAGKAFVAITNENPAYFEVSIEAANGNVVYYKQTDKPITDYGQVYDFKDLPAGQYVLNLKVNDTKVYNNFEVSGRGVEVGESKVRFAPYFDFSGNQLKVSYLNFDHENVKLYFYNDSKGLVYETKLGDDFNITKGYDLSKLENGSYKIVLSSINNEYTYNVEK